MSSTVFYTFLKTFSLVSSFSWYFYSFLGATIPYCLFSFPTSITDQFTLIEHPVPTSKCPYSLWLSSWLCVRSLRKTTTQNYTIILQSSIEFYQDGCPIIIINLITPSLNSTCILQKPWVHLLIDVHNISDLAIYLFLTFIPWRD